MIYSQRGRLSRTSDFLRRSLRVGTQVTGCGGGLKQKHRTRGFHCTRCLHSGLRMQYSPFSLPMKQCGREKGPNLHCRYQHQNPATPTQARGATLPGSVGPHTRIIGAPLPEDLHTEQRRDSLPAGVRRSPFLLPCLSRLDGRDTRKGQAWYATHPLTRDATSPMEIVHSRTSGGYTINFSLA